MKILIYLSECINNLLHKWLSLKMRVYIVHATLHLKNQYLYILPLHKTVNMVLVQCIILYIQCEILSIFRNMDTVTG